MARPIPLPPPDTRQTCPASASSRNDSGQAASSSSVIPHCLGGSRRRRLLIYFARGGSLGGQLGGSIRIAIEKRNSTDCLFQSRPVVFSLYHRSGGGHGWIGFEPPRAGRGAFLRRGPVSSA